MYFISKLFISIKVIFEIELNFVESSLGGFRNRLQLKYSREKFKEKGRKVE